VIPTRQGSHPLLRNRGRSNDGEALQTDVMRFMAILGMCLTAVFALVQSLPVEQAARLQEAELSRQTGRLQEQMAQVKLELRQAQQQLATAGSQLTDQQRHRIAGESRLQAIDGQLREKSQLLAALRREHSSRASELRGLAQQIEQAQVVATTPADSADAVPKLDEPGQQVQSESKGFLLRFASAEALDGLVKSGQVGFSGIVKRKAWKLSLNGTEAVFRVHAAPGKMHEMAPQTVPSRYLRAFREAAGNDASGTVVWGVTLPAVMERKIHMLTEQAQGGVLVIQADGEVSLNRGGQV
jgi:hypothetical protein